MQYPHSPRSVQTNMTSYISSSPQSLPSAPRFGRVSAKPWSIHKKQDVVGGDDLKKPTKPSQRHSSSPQKSYTSTIGPRPSDYESWDFGKKKKKATTKHRPTPAKTRATRTIQRMIRGWWARMNFKVMLLQFKLSHKDELTKKAIKRMEKGIEKTKQNERQKLQAAHDVVQDSEHKQEETMLEGKELIVYLRKENKKLRDKNTKIRDAAIGLKAHNDRLEGANTQTDGSMGVLAQHAKQIEETHAKLTVVEPKYRESVEQLSRAVEQHRQYCLAEHAIKLMYVKLIGKMVEMMEQGSQQAELTDEIAGYVLAMEGKDNSTPLPEELTPPNDNKDGDMAKPKSTKLGTHFSQQKQGNDDEEDSGSDSEDYDEYSVATFD